MIYINLIPRSLWYLNLRKMLSEQQWKKLSNDIRQEQNWTCQACNISLKQLKNKKYFHCHEMWDFDDKKCEVKLLCLITLCSHCHLATHIGFASIQNKDNFALKHLCKVNKWDIETAKLYVEGNFEIWSQRSNKEWKFDVNSFYKWMEPDMVDSVLKSIESKKSS